MKPKTKLTSRPVAELVAAGEAEIGMQQIVAILPVKGAELVGPLPSELQNVIIYAAGIAAGARKARPRARLLRFLATPQVLRLIRAKAWSRVSRVSSGSADVLAPSRFYAHISLTWSGSADTYRPLSAGGELRQSERPAGSPYKLLKVVAFLALSLARGRGVTPRRRKLKRCL